MQENHQPDYQLFLNWFHDEGGLSTKIKFPEFFQSIGVTGVAAFKSIQANQVFLAIPKKLIISIEKVEKSELGTILQRYNCFRDNDDRQFNVAALYVIWQKMLGKSSFYFPYLQAMQQSQTIVNWSDSDIQKMGDPNITVEFVTELRKSFQQIFEQFQLIAKQHPQLFKQPITWQLFMQSYALVMTRCFGWGLPQLMLVPYVDFLNHSCHGIHCYTFNKQLEEESTELDQQYIKKRKQLNLRLLGIDNRTELPKSYERDKREEFVFRHKDILESSSKYSDVKRYDYDQRLHNQETKQCVDIIHQEIMQNSYDVELLASSNSEDNDSSQQDDEQATKLKQSLTNLIHQQLEPQFEQPKPEVNRQFGEEITFKWWYKMSEDDTYLIVSASRFIEQGEQIFNSYGSRSNKFLLVYYGFTHIANKYDSVGFRFWNEEIYEKTGKLVFVKWLTEKDQMEYLCLGNQRYGFESISEQFRLKLDNICYQLMAFLRVRIINKRQQFKTMFTKKLLTFHKIHSLQLQMFMLEDYMSALKQVTQIYQPYRQREEINNKERNFFAQILLSSNRNIIENHVKGVNMLIKVINKLKQGNISLILVYRSALTQEEQKFEKQHCQINQYKTIKYYFKMLAKYFERIKEK